MRPTCASAHSPLKHQGVSAGAVLSEQSKSRTRKVYNLTEVLNGEQNGASCTSQRSRNSDNFNEALNMKYTQWEPVIGGRNILRKQNDIKMCVCTCTHVCMCKHAHFLRHTTILKTKLISVMAKIK